VRSSLWPMSFPVYASIVLFGVCLRNNCNTRYEWLVRPYSTGTFTLKEAPSFAWRTNGLASRSTPAEGPRRGEGAAAAADSPSPFSKKMGRVAAASLPKVPAEGPRRRSPPKVPAEGPRRGQGAGGRAGWGLPIIAPFLAKRACARAAEPAAWTERSEVSDWSRCWALIANISDHWHKCCHHPK